MKKTILKIGIVIVLLAIIIEGVVLIKAKTYKPQNPIATIQIEGYDKPIKLELDPQSAPNEVANFIKLSNNGFYNGMALDITDETISVDKSHDKAKMSNLMENPASDYIYGVKGDTLLNGYDNLIKHKKGVITMEWNYDNITSYTDLYNSANYRFSILTKDIDELNGSYAGFGKVVEGMDILDTIAEKYSAEKTEETETENKTEENNEAKEETIKIKSISVDTFGIDYGVPEVINLNPSTSNNVTNNINSDVQTDAE